VLQPLVVTCAAISLTGCVAQSAVLDETWFACDADRACALVPDPASCVLIPVNRHHAAAFGRRLALEHVGQQPRSCSARIQDYRPICLEARCSSQPSAPSPPSNGRVREAQ